MHPPRKFQKFTKRIVQRRKTFLNSPRVHYKECEKKFFITSFQDKTTEWRQCSLGGAWGLYDNAQQAINDVEKCKEAHEYSWREK